MLPYYFERFVLVGSDPLGGTQSGEGAKGGEGGRLSLVERKIKGKRPFSTSGCG